MLNIQLEIVSYSLKIFQGLIPELKEPVPKGNLRTRTYIGIRIFHHKENGIYIYKRDKLTVRLLLR